VNKAALPTARRRFHSVVLLAGIGSGLTAPFTALLVVGLGGTTAWAAFVVSSMGLSLLLVDFFGTRFVPRLASASALTASMVVFGIGSLLSAATTNWLLVGLARVLQGFGTALFMGGAVVLAVRLVEPGRRGGAIGTFNAVWFLGIASGPICGGLIAAQAPGTDGLRLLFAVCGVVNLAGAAVAWFLVPRLPAGPPPSLGLPRGLDVRGRREWSVLVLAGLGQAVRSGLALTLLPLLGARLGMGPLGLGVALFALAVTDVGAMHFGAGWADRRGRMVPLAAALGWGSVAVTALGTVVHDLLTFTIAALAVGVTVGSTWVLPVAMAVDLAREPEAAIAAYRIASDIGMLAGGLLAALGIAAGGIHAALLGAAALLVGGLLLTVSIRETLPPTPLSTAPHPAPPLTEEEPVPLPPIDQLALLAAYQDLTLTPERLAQAHGTHTEGRPMLERVRALPLPFVESETEPVCEPATALAWIARGGRS
jgi:MFS family permease